MLTQVQKDQLNEIAVWKPVSFPNGSNYQKQRLPEGSRNGIQIEIEANYGYHVTFPDGQKAEIGFSWKSVGPGSDLGKHFCTRDQALTALV